MESLAAARPCSKAIPGEGGGGRGWGRGLLSSYSSPRVAQLPRRKGAAVGLLQAFPPSGARASCLTIFLLQRKAAIRPASSSSSPSPSTDPGVDAETNNSDSEIQTAYQQKTVHVKFMLQRSCLFGQQLLLVGEDPMLGLWDPASAIPLEWSDDHVWTAEMDLPVGKAIQFKFIVRGSSGEIKWQPGPNRVLQTWESTNTIVVLEDWENAENQKATEEIFSAETGTGTDAEVVIDENYQKDVEDAEQKVKGQEGLEGDPVLVPGLSSMNASLASEDTKISEEESAIFVGNKPDEIMTEKPQEDDPEETQTRSRDGRLLEENLHREEENVSEQQVGVLGDIQSGGGNSLKVFWTLGLF